MTRQRVSGAGAPAIFVGRLKGRGMAVGGVGGTINDLDAPTLTWTSAGNDNTPNFDLGIPISSVAGDVIRIESAVGVVYVSHTLTSGDISGGPTIDLSSVTPVADGSYNFRARMERSPNHISAWTANEAVTIDATAPTITTNAVQSVNEGSTLGIALTASESVLWTITGGADQARYEISGTTLRWASNGTKSYATPDDSDTNNTYVVQVTATDAAGNATNKTITTTVNQLPFVPRQFMLGRRYINQTGNRQWQAGARYNVES